MSSVKKALTAEAGFMNLKADASTTSCTFEVEPDFDFEAALNKIVEGGNDHVKGWSKQ